MKLLKYIEQLCCAYKNTFVKMQAEQERNKEEESKLNALKPKYNSETIDKESERIKNEHEQNMNAIIADIKETVKNVRVQYEEAMHKEYEPKGEELNADDVALFNSGIKFTREEIENYAKKYADNRTMLRVLESYVNKGELEVNTTTKLMFEKNNALNEIAMNAFEVFAHKSKSTIELMTYNAPNNELFAKCNDYVMRYVEEYKREMQMLPIKESEV